MKHLSDYLSNIKLFSLFGWFKDPSECSHQEIVALLIRIFSLCLHSFYLKWITLPFIFIPSRSLIGLVLLILHSIYVQFAHTLPLNLVITIASAGVLWGTLACCSSIKIMNVFISTKILKLSCDSFIIPNMQFIKYLPPILNKRYQEYSKDDVYNKGYFKWIVKPH